MKNYIKYSLLTVIASFGLFIATPNAGAVTIAELIAQIQALQAQLAQLQAQQGTTTAWCHDFNVNLKIGDTGYEVANLIIALQKETLITEHEANFDEQVASVVTAFQQKYKEEILTPLGLQYGTGFVGSATRAKLNKLYGCSITPPQPACQTFVTCLQGYTSYDTGKKDSNNCPIMRCISPTDNQPPVISGVSGPTALKVNETGTWTIKASDPEQGILTYSVIWGDEGAFIGSTSTLVPTTYVQTATFTHSYIKAGTYNPSFNVGDDKGLSVRTSISVNVGNISQLCPLYSLPLCKEGEKIVSGGYDKNDCALPGKCVSTTQPSITSSRTPQTATTSPFVAGNQTVATYQFAPWYYFQGKDWLLKSKTTDTVTGAVVNDADFIAGWSDIVAQNLCNNNGYCPMSGTWEASQFQCSTNSNNIRKREDWVVVNGVESNHNVFYFKCSNTTTISCPVNSDPDPLFRSCANCESQHKWIYIYAGQEITYLGKIATENATYLYLTIYGNINAVADCSLKFPDGRLFTGQISGDSGSCNIRIASQAYTTGGEVYLKPNISGQYLPKGYYTLKIKQAATQPDAMFMLGTVSSGTASMGFYEPSGRVITLPACLH